MTGGGSFFVGATTIDDLKNGISAKAKEIEQIELDIEKYKQQIALTGKDISTLSGKIKNLEATKKKLESDILVTQKKIEATSLTIQSLSDNIDIKNEAILVHQDALVLAMNEIMEDDQRSLTETILSSASVSEIVDAVEKSEQFQKEVNDRLDELKQLRQGLVQDKAEADSQKKKLETMKTNLADQKKIAESNRLATNGLLSQTKNKEANYKKLLADKMARRDEFEREMLDFESQLKIAIDPNSLPLAAHGVLTWPLDSVVITQYFGNTEFAQAHTAVYNGKGHNGVDFRASMGTQIKSAQSGIVLGTGNTDLTCAGASYGRWVLIKHNNGLTTLYAHLSLIKVSQGDQVVTGQLIGYSGDTGYATGPHLHFSVFASQGVKIGSLKSKNPSCGTYTLPVASLNSYLDPLNYL